MILYCTRNKNLELWFLDLAGTVARPPAGPTVYALVSFEAERIRYYVGSSRHLTARVRAHLSFARSRKLRGQSGGGLLMAPVVARRRRALVIVLETLPGAGSAQLRRRERAWILAALRDAGGDALAHQVTPPQESDERGPRAPAQLASQRHWPASWVEALAAFFREPRRAQGNTLDAGERIPSMRSLAERATAARHSGGTADSAAAAE